MKNKKSLHRKKFFNHYFSENELKNDDILEYSKKNFDCSMLDDDVDKIDEKLLKSVGVNLFYLKYSFN
jgi:hypothetical protein